MAMSYLPLVVEQCYWAFICLMEKQRCKLHVLYVTSLSYNLLSVSKVAQSEKVTKFGKLSGNIWNTAILGGKIKVG